jgi:alpha-galactosidase
MEQECPQALLLNFTNPETKVCEAITRLTNIQAIGLCHGVFAGRHALAFVLGMPEEELDTAACGLNHFSWFQEVRRIGTGEDLYPRLRALERTGDWLADWHEIALPRVLLRRFGLWPSPGTNHIGEYIRWADEFIASELQYFYDAADGHPWQGGSVPEFVYSVGHIDSRRPFQPNPAPQGHIEDAELAPSGELAVPIIEGIVCDVSRTLDAVNVPNKGSIPGLDPDTVVEVPALVDAQGVCARKMAPLPDGITAMLRQQAAIHNLLVQAFAERSRNKLLQALLLDPTVHSYRGAVQCVDEMISIQRSLLPQFEDGPWDSYTPDR